MLYFPILLCLGGEAKLQLRNHSHPRQLTPPMKLSQSVINYMISIENGSEVSNSFVQGLTMCVCPLHGPVLLMLSRCHRLAPSKTPLISG